MQGLLDLGGRLEPPLLQKNGIKVKGPRSYKLQPESHSPKSEHSKSPEKSRGRARMPAPTNNPCRSQPAGDSANPNNKNPKAEPKTHSHQIAQQCQPTHHNPCGSQPAGDSANPNNKNPKAEPKTHSHQTAEQCPPTHQNPCGSQPAGDSASPNNKNTKLDLKPTHIKQPNYARQPTTIPVGPVGPVGPVDPVGAGLARDDASPSNINAESTTTIPGTPYHTGLSATKYQPSPSVRLEAGPQA